MIDIHSNIKRLKTHIKLTDLDTNSSKGWKELISIVKSNTCESYNEDNPNSQLTVSNKLAAQDLTSAYLSNTVPALNSPIDFRTCNDCGRPVAYSALLYHLHTYCPGKAKGANNGHSADRAREVSPTKGKNMKRTNSVEPDQSPSKKQRKSATPTVKKQRKVKQRNPTEPHLVDLDKQCGVELPESGVCGRSLTCKSHSMGAKRAVQGRSKPFDVLLAEYQKKNHIKNAAKGSRTKIQSTHQQQQVVKQKQQEKSAESDIPVLTPEEETTQVLNGVSRSFPLPLETTVLTSTQTRTKYFRMREMLASSFSVRPGYSTPGYGAIHSRVGCIDLDRTTDYTFRIRVPQLVNQSSLHNGGAQQQFQSSQPNRARHAPHGLPVEALSQQQQATPQQMQPTQLLSNRQPPQQQVNMLQFQPHGHTPQYTARAMTDHISAANMPFDTQTAIDSGNYDRPMTPKDAGQQVLMQQQRLQQRKKLEDASAQLDTASKLIQGGPINVATGPVVDGSTVGPSVNMGGQGRVNVGLINGYDRLN